MNGRAHGFLTLAPIYDNNGEAVDVKITGFTQTRPKEPKGQIVELDFQVDLAIFAPMSLTLKGALSRVDPELEMEVDAQSIFGQALAAAKAAKP